MKRLALILGLVLLFALAACDTMGPQEALPTTGVGTTVAGEATAVPVDATVVAPAEGEGETAATPGADLRGTTWEWVSLVDASGQTTATYPARYTITFNEGDVANVITCRTPGNRNPEPDEVATCSPFLRRQIEVIRPKVIVALGTFTAQTPLQTKTPITKLRWQVLPFRGGDVKVIPTFRPSFLLRKQKNRDLYRDVWNDMKQARALITAAD